MAKVVTQREVKIRIKGLAPEQAKAVVCALVGHSRIQTYCLGYFNCARCGDQVGDNLAGVYDGSKSVIVGHDCKVCRKNFAALDWTHTFMTPDPFEAAA